MTTTNVGAGIVIIFVYVLRTVLGQFPGTCLPLTHACENGYAFDGNGCQVCNDPTGEETDVTSSPAPVLPSSRSFIKPCVIGTTCDIECKYGYLSTPFNTCQYCICAKPEKPKYDNPCPDQPDRCNLPCLSGFKLSPTGCQTCQCINDATFAPNTVAPPLTAEECTMRITTCQIKFPFGFMMFKDCSDCTGKDEIYAFSNIPEDKQPIIQLANPCIQGLDICRIVCRTGYKTGPRGCQYCACNN